jgi:hypothetical protein
MPSLIPFGPEAIDLIFGPQRQTSLFLFTDYADEPVAAKFREAASHIDNGVLFVTCGRETEYEVQMAGYLAV